MYVTVIVSLFCWPSHSSIFLQLGTFRDVCLSTTSTPDLTTSSPDLLTISLATAIIVIGILVLIFCVILVTWLFYRASKRSDKSDTMELQFEQTALWLQKNSDDQWWLIDALTLELVVSEEFGWQEKK